MVGGNGCVKFLSTGNNCGRVKKRFNGFSADNVKIRNVKCQMSNSKFQIPIKFQTSCHFQLLKCHFTKQFTNSVINSTYQPKDSVFSLFRLQPTTQSTHLSP